MSLRTLVHGVALQRHVATLIVLASAALQSCGTRRVALAQPVPTQPVLERAQPQAVAALATTPARHGQLVTFAGTCDASGAVPLDAQRFAVVDDEDNTLRVYDAELGGAPQAAFDLSAALSLPAGGEADLEAATRIGDQAYFLSSHGLTSRGQPDPNRFAFFSLQLTGNGGASLAGRPYRTLLSDLLAAPALQSFQLDGAMARGALSFEGMTATPDSRLWLGLRSPVPNGRAIVLQMANPREVMSGARPRLELAHSLDLGGLGVRGLSYWRGSYLVLAGPAGDGGPFALYRWQGSGQPQLLEAEPLQGLGPEGFFSHEAREEVLVLSDDGTRLVNGQPCKSLSLPEHKSFRGVWLVPGQGVAAPRASQG